ncbi:hypothetical protein H0H93_006188, partial [Arthromyces matolae]
MKPYLTTTVCFFLIIGIGHVNALPLATHNQLVPREDFPTLKKLLYTRADNDVDSGRTEGPGTDGEGPRKKAKLDADSEHLAVSSETGTPKLRKPLPTVGRPRGRDQMQKTKNGKLGKEMIMTGLSTTDDSQPLDESPPSVNVKSADSGDESPTTSETTAPETLDIVKANPKNLVFEYRDTITATEARELLKTMVDAKLETNNLPWKRKGVWSDEVLRVMIRVLREYKRKAIDKEYTKEQKEARKGLKYAAYVRTMARPDLEDELDVLWKWRVHRNQVLDADSEHLAVSSETGTPKLRTPLQNVGRSRGREKSADSGNASPTTSETAAPETLDTVKANPKNLLFEHRGTITVTEARKLLKTMLDAKLETNSLPWKRKGVWSDEVLREMIQVLRSYKSKVISKEYTQAQKEALKQGKKTSKNVRNMDRSNLEIELDGLWKWVVERHDEKGDRGSRDLVKIKEGLEVVDEKKLLWLLFRNVPIDTSDMSKMPWREAKFQWKPEWVKTLLMRIWSIQHGIARIKFKEPKVRFDVEISSLEGEQREAAIKNAMDDAWKWWLHRDVWSDYEIKKLPPASPSNSQRVDVHLKVETLERQLNPSTMKSHFVQLAAACFISLLLINHASALPTNSRNRILAREDNDGLTKSLYHRSTDGHIETNINSLTIRAPVGGDEHRTPKAKVPRTSPAPKGREDGEPGKRARTGKKQKDDATDLQDVRKLLDTMIAAQEDEAQGNVEQKKTMPWNDDNRWPDGLVWAAIAELFERRERYFTANHVKQRDRPDDIQLKDEMERSELNTELDKLWLWAVERKR